MYKVDKKNGSIIFTPDRLLPTEPPSSISSLRKPVTRIEWATSPLGTKGPGYLIVAGGNLLNDPNGVSVVWQPHHQSVNNSKFDTWDNSTACSVILPTADGGNVIDFEVCYERGVEVTSTTDAAPSPHHPCSIIVLCGNAQAGLAPKIFVHPLPKDSASNAWPPIAADPPLPLPVPKPLQPYLQTRPSLLFPPITGHQCYENVNVTILKAFKDSNRPLDLPEDWEVSFILYC